jgi:hypothetical protein
MPAKHTTRTVWSSEEEKEEAKAKAAQRGITLSKLIRQQMKKVPLQK